MTTLAQQDRILDFSKVKDPGRAMRNAVLRFVRGYRGQRKTEVSTRQIQKHFVATPWDFVHAQVLNLLVDGRLDCGRNGLSDRAGVSYVVNAPMCLLFDAFMKKSGEITTLVETPQGTGERWAMLVKHGFATPLLDRADLSLPPWLMRLTDEGRRCLSVRYDDSR